MTITLVKRSGSNYKQGCKFHESWVLILPVVLWVLRINGPFPVPVNDLEQKTMVTMVSMCIKQILWQGRKCH